MQKVLVDRGELVLENEVEETEDPWITRERRDGRGAYAA
jgi:hypothetical protein